MNDLISRQKLLKDMKRNCVGNCLKCADFTILSSNLHCGVIDRQPTAYDLEAVVRELEEEVRRIKDEERRCFLEGNTKLGFCLNGKASGLTHAIEVIKRGGRNDSNT